MFGMYCSEEDTPSAPSRMRLVDERLHARELLRRRGAVLAPDDHRADASRADEGPEVDRGARAARASGNTRRASSSPGVTPYFS